MTTQVVAEQPVVVSPIATLTTAFTAITTALEAHKSQDGAVESARESEARALEALTTAKDRTVSAKSVATSGVTGVLAALDSADAAIESVRGEFTA